MYMRIRLLVQFTRRRVGTISVLRPLIFPRHDCYPNFELVRCLIWCPVTYPWMEAHINHGLVWIYNAGSGSLTQSPNYLIASGIH